MPRRRQVLQSLGAGTATVLGGCLATAPRATHAFDPLAETDLQEHASAQLQGGLRNRGYVETTIPRAVTRDWSLPVNRGDHTAAKASPVPTPDGDVIIGATADVVGEPVLTRNVEDFERLGVPVETY